VFGPDGGIPSLASALKRGAADPAHERTADSRQSKDFRPNRTYHEVEQWGDKYQLLDEGGAHVWAPVRTC
jgi:hypothetical protein